VSDNRKKREKKKREKQPKKIKDTTSHDKQEYLERKMFQTCNEKCCMPKGTDVWSVFAKDRV